MNKESNFISALVYCHNDRKVYDFLDFLYQYLEKTFDAFEIIIVNDNSNFNTKELLSTFCKNKKENSITLINLSYYHGIDKALNAGLSLCIGDFVYIFDEVDINYDSNILQSLYEKAQEGFDIVIGCPSSNSLKSKIIQFFVEKMLHLKDFAKIKKMMLVTRRSINRLFSIEKVIYLYKFSFIKCGLPISSVHYLSKTKESHEKNYMKNFLKALFIYSKIPYKFSLFITSLGFIFILLISLFAIYDRIAGNPISGWTSLILFLGIAFEITFATFYIILRYQKIIFDLLNKNTDFLYESIEKN